MKLFPISTLTHRLLTGKQHLFRRFTTAAAATPSPQPQEIKLRDVNKMNLFNRISAVGATGEKISDVLKQMIENGEKFGRSDLIFCIKDLRKFGRYNHSLQIHEWMQENKYKFVEADYALRLNLLAKVKGIGQAEKFFDSIPPDYKNNNTYGALLNCYCSSKKTDKAFALFKKMDELNYTNYLAYNNLMSLCLKVWKPEKVPSLVEEMKQRNIPLNNFSYYMWIQSYKNSADYQGLEQLMQEVEMKDSLKEDWVIYSNVAFVYSDAGQSEKAFTAWNKVAELLDKLKNPNRKGYHYLIAGYASIGKSECVYQVWDKLKSRCKALVNLSYLTMLQALSKLDDIEGLKKYLKEWELSRVSYDERLPDVVIGAFLRLDLPKEAEQLLKDEKVYPSGKTRKADIMFMSYYLRKHQFDSALKHMEAAVAEDWRPRGANLKHFFIHFIKEKDVDSAEELCRKLEKFQAIDSETYLFLFQTYAAAGKQAPDMRQRMKRNGVDVSPEHEELLQKIC